ncbi:hypothetical protein C0Q70_04153 [Pomacea canaliculata]|uniref:Nose resistant-to-fluoxetine protein N-terminal domain-containing protein n=1 Tax=Pomacea canaliculata TaxID=400727 RepID=A0A2T7PUR6_POMCA|nr:hypothetical protein C0Q70_04153 [Pomacea canaliculata]
MTEASHLRGAPGAREQASRQMPDAELWSVSGKVRKVLASKDNPLESVLFPRMWDAITDAGRNSGKYNVSEMCSAGLSIYTKSLDKMEPWAIRMYDATGKESSGLLMGDLTQQGNYDEGILSALLMLNVIGTCLDIKQRLKMADILSGNVMEIGEMGRRFSRFSASIFLHRRSTDTKTEPGGNAEGDVSRCQTQLAEAVSDSLMRRRSSLGAMYHQRRKLSDGWKPLDRDSIVIHKGGIQTLRTISIGVDENSPTDQENSNGTVHYITESGSKSWDTDKINADGLQSADTQVDNNNIPMSSVRTDVGVSQSGLPIDVSTEVVAVNGQLHAGVNDIHDEDNSGEVDGCSEPQVPVPSPTRQTALQNPSTDNLVNPESRDCDNKQLSDASCDERLR